MRLAVDLTRPYFLAPGAREPHLLLLQMSGTSIQQAAIASSHCQTSRAVAHGISWSFLLAGVLPAAYVARQLRQGGNGAKRPSRTRVYYRRSPGGDENTRSKNFLKPQSCTGAIKYFDGGKFRTTSDGVVIIEDVVGTHTKVNTLKWVPKRELWPGHVSDDGEAFGILQPAQEVEVLVITSRNEAIADTKEWIQGVVIAVDKNQKLAAVALSSNTGRIVEVPWTWLPPKA